mmetsp:Transcript_66351/g.154170  ORF Transcript_66351/g.154170 Transcript_66351/m.154170 type:complete len:451 (+) Transcript_66351:74-1426(+)|eukprot:CAMPEP_0171104238 /NCGR_PEP_ID=MMETSP0766_2-20121228/60257_1 /TAXON_ID=439317 /ORGANISM="Gambierdiscus australes, Strain CAWD 149" /LENGTH=450 /DNA_ID=CAMNT_0011564831 /DNA_START=74 /DNA_END=1426 /DNA_ORIENTATION=+
MTNGGEATATSTYTFSSAPKPVVGTRKKYRDPGEDTTLYRDLKETCITWDKRVHRGNTYSVYTQNAVREALQQESETPPTMTASSRARRRQRPKEPKLFDMPLPEHERIPVDLTKHLTAKEEVVETGTVEAQTDEFLPEPPREMLQPQKTGVDAETQVVDGELFVFDLEVEPILDVIVNKTLEQSLMEVEEEHELEKLAEFKAEWYKRQQNMMREWQEQVDAEWERWEEKEQLMEAKRVEKKREARVLLKIQAINAAKQHLSRVVPDAISDLQEVAFPDMKGMAINRVFLPQLFGLVQQEVQSMRRAQQQMNELVVPLMRKRASAQASGLASHRERTRELERRAFEETEIRQGRIRIHVDTGGGHQVPVGPIQISTADDIDVTQRNVFEWLKENNPKVASAWPSGVLLCVNGEPVKTTKEIFEAKAGQISLVPKPALPHEASAAPEEVTT